MIKTNIQKLLLITTILLSLSFALDVQAGVLYVKPGGTGDGISWAEAFGDPQKAIELAADNPDYSEVWVAAGTYKPRGHPNGTYKPRDVHFSLRNGVTVYGGFAGIESDLSQRDIKAYETIFSGNIGFEDNNGDNAHHVFYHHEGTGLNESAVLDGVTITAGNADGGTPPDSRDGRGGGIHNVGGHPTLINVTISGNKALYSGGGIYSRSSNLTLKNVIIINNKTGSHGHGGGIYIDLGSPFLSNVKIIDNQAQWDGGGIYNRNSNPTLKNVTINNNTASRHGGGIVNTWVNPVLENVTISGNQASLGGGIYNFKSNPTLTNITISNNSSDEGGGIYNEDNSNPSIVNATINSNSADYGGGVLNLDSSPKIQNSILWGNNAREFGNEYINTGTSEPDISWSIIQGGYPDGNNIIAEDPFLNPLADNGGFTKTHSIPKHSPAYAIPQGAGAKDWNESPNEDQREMPRATIGYRAIGAYEEFESGSIKINIEPADALASGAQWRRTDSYSWQDSGYVENVAVGEYEVEFKRIDGWDEPDNIDITVSEGENFESVVVYEQIGENDDDDVETDESSSSGCFIDTLKIGSSGQ